MSMWANGARALAICDICGFQYRLGQLRKLVVNELVTELKACPACWVPDQPQLQVGKYPVTDAQAVKDPRPDPALLESRDIQYAWNPVGGGQGDGTMTPNYLLATGAVGSVTIG